MYTEHPGALSKPPVAPWSPPPEDAGVHRCPTSCAPQYSGDRTEWPLRTRCFCRAPLHPPEALGLPWHIWELNLARLKNSVIEKFRSFVAGSVYPPVYPRCYTCAVEIPEICLKKHPDFASQHPPRSNACQPQGGSRTYRWPKAPAVCSWEKKQPT